MSEIGLVEIFGMAEAIALIGTLFVILYFSRKQMQSLSLDIEQSSQRLERKDARDYNRRD